MKPEQSTVFCANHQARRPAQKQILFGFKYEGDWPGLRIAAYATCPGVFGMMAPCDEHANTDIGSNGSFFQIKLGGNMVTNTIQLGDQKAFVFPIPKAHRHLLKLTFTCRNSCLTQAHNPMTNCQLHFVVVDEQNNVIEETEVTQRFRVVANPERDAGKWPKSKPRSRRKSRKRKRRESLLITSSM